MASTLKNQLDLYVDLDNERLVKSFTSTKQAPPPTFTFGDVRTTTVRLLRRTSEENSADNPYREIDMTATNVKLSLADVGTKPSLGTFQLTFDGSTTINLAYDASASNIQTELNALASITSNGSVVVQKPTSGFYRVIFNNTGAQSRITGDGTLLYPSSTITVNEAVAGGASQREVQLISIEPDAAVSQTLSTGLPAAASTITTVRQGDSTNGIAEVQTILLDPEPYGGTWLATTNSGSVTNTSSPIPWNASASALQSALINTNSTIFTNKITVTGGFPEYTVEFDATIGNTAPLTTDLTDLDVPVGRKGEMNCAVTGFRELLGGAKTKSAVLEVSVLNTTNTTEYTGLHQPVTIREDV